MTGTIRSPWVLARYSKTGSSLLRMYSDARKAGLTNSTAAPARFKFAWIWAVPVVAEADVAVGGDRNQLLERQRLQVEQ